LGRGRLRCPTVGKKTFTSKESLKQIMEKGTGARIGRKCINRLWKGTNRKKKQLISDCRVPTRALGDPVRANYWAGKMGGGGGLGLKAKSSSSEMEPPGDLRRKRREVPLTKGARH